MISGIGNDIIEIKRIEKAVCDTPSFLTRLFTENEITTFGAKKKSESIAGVFAAKEAVAKALGTGFSGFSPRDIEILKNVNGKPYVVLHNGAYETAKKQSVAVVHVGISHSEHYASAVAVAEVSEAKV